MATKNIGTLQPGQTVTLTGTYKAAESDMGKTDLINTVTAKSGVATASAKSAAAKMEAVRYAFDATKTQNNTPADGTAFDEGETVIWDIKATNTGNQTLSGLKITEKLTGAVLPFGDTLSDIAPKGSATKQAQYKIANDDLGREDLRNVVDIANAKTSKSNVYSPFIVLADKANNFNLTIGELVCTEPSGIANTPSSNYVLTNNGGSGSITINSDADTPTISVQNTYRIVGAGGLSLQTMPGSHYYSGELGTFTLSGNMEPSSISMDDYYGGFLSANFRLLKGVSTFRFTVPKYTDDPYMVGNYNYPALGIQLQLTFSSRDDVGRVNISFPGGSKTIDLRNVPSGGVKAESFYLYAYKAQGSATVYEEKYHS